MIMKRSILLAVSWGFVFIFATLLGGCYNGVAHIRAGIEDHVNRNSTIDTCLTLVAIAPRILHGKYYYDRCLFQGPGKETSWAYCPKNSLESGKMTLGRGYMVHANFWGKYGSTIDPNEGFFFDADGEVISCQK
ncbi:MAG: hypothetical protein ACD_7C00016G0006 [uncultured bacterium]|nr:MAG: hypothetical protein ACD_7C00016G0006 [uncultured bacterium]HBR79181.1 hypothetical protein [Candidatus Moranbacteria bacterium]